MSKKFSEEEFQGFVVEQFGKLTTSLSDVRTDLIEVRAELGDIRRDVTSVQTGLADVRLEMQTGFRELRTEVAEIKSILEPLVRAFDSDAEKIVEHDRRIDRLEQHGGIVKHA